MNKKFKCRQTTPIYSLHKTGSFQRCTSFLSTMIIQFSFFFISSTYRYIQCQSSCNTASINLSTDLFEMTGQKGLEK
ncbi:hypothetical protein EB796_002143 [Bugula neritina]|uniref:Uncharacterized protein n=1 Tax=Bugula neritina TaxID=10212 RepID=A0A7J7KN12_BUGNE|nr:hypothetical protein EB796_002143 [Bugula neritina]